MSCPQVHPPSFTSFFKNDKKNSALAFLHYTLPKGNDVIKKYLSMKNASIENFMFIIANCSLNTSECLNCCQSINSEDSEFFEAVKAMHEEEHFVSQAEAGWEKKLQKFLSSEEQ